MSKDELIDAVFATGENKSRLTAHFHGFLMMKIEG